MKNQDQGLEKLSVDLNDLSVESFETSLEDVKVAAYATGCPLSCKSENCETIVCCYPSDGNDST